MAPLDDASSQHRHRGVPAVQRMVEYAPSSGGLALWCGHQDLDDDGAARPGAGGVTVVFDAGKAPVVTDGRTLFYARAFDKLPLDEQAGWVAHAVLHIALRHAQRYGALQRRLGHADLALFNLCADAIVNSTLSHVRWLKLPAGAVRLEGVLAEVLDIRQGDAAALLTWDVERLYLAVDDRRGRGSDASRPKQGGGEGQHEGAQQPTMHDGPRAARLRQLGAQQARDLHSHADGGQGGVSPEEEAELTRDWAERLQRAHAGDGVHSMWRVLGADLPRVRTPWEQVLRTQLARGLSMRPGLSWSRPSRSYMANQGRSAGGRRLPWEPGTTTARAVPRLALVVDVSGSIEDGLLERFSREVQAICRRQEAALVLVVGDDTVRRVEHHEPGRTALPGPQGFGFRGGGGTDFTPLLAEAVRHRPDLIVVLTDLDGPARQRPPCPVLWAVTEAHAGAVAPFGRVLVLR